MTDLRRYIRDVPDFPKPGIVFKDITPLLRSPEALDAAMQALAEPYRDQRISNILATGGTAAAAAALVKEFGATIVGAGFVIELDFLEGRKKLDIPVHSLIRY